MKLHNLTLNLTCVLALCGSLPLVAQQPEQNWTEQYLTLPHTPEYVRSQLPSNPTPLQLQRFEMYQRLYNRMQQEGGVPLVTPPRPSFWQTPEAYDVAVGVRAQARRHEIYAGTNDAYYGYSRGPSVSGRIGPVAGGVGASVTGRAHIDGSFDGVVGGSSTAIAIVPVPTHGGPVPVPLGVRTVGRYNPATGEVAASVGPVVGTHGYNVSVPITVNYDPRQVHTEQLPTLDQWHQNVDRYLNDWESQRMRQMPLEAATDEFAARMLQSQPAVAQQTADFGPSALVNEVRSQARVNFAQSRPEVNRPPADNPSPGMSQDGFRRQVEQEMQRFRELNNQRMNDSRQQQPSQSGQLVSDGSSRPIGTGDNVLSLRQRESSSTTGSTTIVYNEDAAPRRSNGSMTEARRPEVPNVQRRQPGTRSQTASLTLSI